MLSHAKPGSITRGSAGKAVPHWKFFLPLEKCVGHSLKLLDVVLKNWTLLRKPFAPPGVPSWLRVCTRLLEFDN